MRLRLKRAAAPRPFLPFVAVALAIGFAVSAGCSGGSTGTVPPGQLRLVYIPKNTGNPYFNRVIVGFKNPPAGVNIHFDTEAPATADATAQIPIIKDQIQRGVDVIALSADSQDALDAVLDQARAKGITVVTVDSDLTGNETHRDIGVLQADANSIAEGQIALLGKLMNYQGDFAILSAKIDAPNQNAWIAAMKTVLQQPKYAKMNLLTVVYGNDDPQKSTTETESLLSKYPNLKGILSPTSVGLSAAAQVLENAGVFPGGPNAKNGGIILTGLSTPNEMKKAVQDGVVTSFQLWDPADMGAVAAYLGVQIHEHKLTPKPGLVIDVPGHGKFTIRANNVVYAAPLTTFDKSNIDKYDY